METEAPRHVNQLNLTPLGNKKRTAREVKRKLNSFELKHIQQYRVKEKDIIKIYECENSKWNLMLCKDDFFYSVPKKGTHCSISVFGNIDHVKQEYNLINP